MTRRLPLLPHRPTAVLAALLTPLVLVACGGGGGDAPSAQESNTTVADAASSTNAPSTVAPAAADESTTTTTADPAPTTAPPTTTPPTTAPPTTVAPSTTAAPLTPADLVLRSTGIGPLEFGATVETVLALLTPVLGALAVDESAEYPFEPTPGQFESAESDYGFDYPFERYVCFTNSLCITFGGPNTASLAFVGWAVNDAVPPLLTTAAGIGVDSRWADFTGAMEVQEGGCYNSGSGTTDGIRLALVSTGDMFGSWDADGNYILGTPDPADVVVGSIYSGQLRLMLFGDC